MSRMTCSAQMFLAIDLLGPTPANVWLSYWVLETHEIMGYSKFDLIVLLLLIMIKMTYFAV